MIVAVLLKEAHICASLFLRFKIHTINRGTTAVLCGGTAAALFIRKYESEDKAVSRRV